MAQLDDDKPIDSNDKQDVQLSAAADTSPLDSVKSSDSTPDSTHTEKIEKHRPVDERTQVYSQVPHAYGATLNQDETQPLPQSAYPFGSPEQSSSSAPNNWFNPYNNGASNQFNVHKANPFMHNHAPQSGLNSQNNVSSGSSTGSPHPPVMPVNNNPHHSPEKKKSAAVNPWLISIVSAVITAVIVLGLGWICINRGLVVLPEKASTSSLASATGSSGTVTVTGGEAPDWTAINKKVASSVVSITVKFSNGIAKGSGAILNKKGDIVTNDHVIEDAESIEVTLLNGNMYAAKVVGTDPTTDLAVIHLIDAPSDLQPVTFANSNDLAVGQRVMSIGNPLGYENTATTGIISALNRPVEVSDETDSNIVTNAVQISSAINPGNSGGPTFDAAGQVIGINSSIATLTSSSSEESGSQSGSIGIGFAIPSNLVKKITNEILTNGKATHAELGITITTGTAQAGDITRTGAKVVSVLSNTPGSRAGLRAGDVIIGFNGNTVSSMYSLLGYVRAASVGETVKITIIRDGKILDLTCTLNKVEQLSGTLKTNQGNSNNSDSGSTNGNLNGNSNSNNDENRNSYGLLDPFGLF